MIFRKLWRLNRSQGGFTLIEAIVTLAITGMIGVGAAAASIQVVTRGGQNSDYTAASRNAMNAIYWISRDAQMSQAVAPDGPAGFPLTLRWTEWDNSEHEITYSIVDDALRRSYAVDGGAASESVVAQFINAVSENTTAEFGGNVLTVKVTATVGEGAHALSVTKVREITPRPGL